MIQVIIENPKTGKSYTCKSYSETTKDITYYHITYSCILRHKDHPFFKQFYHGPNEMNINNEIIYPWRVTLRHKEELGKLRGVYSFEKLVSII